MYWCISLFILFCNVTETLMHSHICKLVLDSGFAFCILFSHRQITISIVMYHDKSNHLSIGLRDKSWYIVIYPDGYWNKFVKKFTDFFRAFFTRSRSIVMWNHDRSWNVVSITIVIDYDLLWCIPMWKIQMCGSHP